MTDTRSHTIVTGGSSGIGAAVVADLLAHGHRVTVFDLASAEAGGEHVGYEHVDVTVEQQVVDAVSRAEAHAGRITGVVACHGVRGAYAPALEIDLDSLRRLYDIHVVGAFAVCREVVRRLEGAPASIVLVSSTTAYRGWVNQMDYGPAKAAVRQMAENLAIEWAPLGVRVNAVAPGHTLTPMVQDMIDRGYDASAVTARTPLGRMALPEETARTIRMLLDDASFVTGQCLAVDGGWTAVGK